MSGTADGVVYQEPGASGWALLWAPAFAVAGYVSEVVSDVPPHTVMWWALGGGLLVLTLMWVAARRRFLCVRVSRSQLWQGRECLLTEQIAQIVEVPAAQSPEWSFAGARVLGGGLTVPRKHDALPLRLHGGTVVLAWARDGEALRAAVESTMSDPVS